MNQKILLISGRKQSGKDSTANYLAGYLLKKHGYINYYELDEDGKLLINYKFLDPDTGKEVEELASLDLERKDIEYAQHASQQIWPIIKHEKFGNLLKDILITIFGCNRQEIYGNDDDKNKLSPVKWENIYKILPHLKPNYLSLPTPVRPKIKHIIEVDTSVEEKISVPEYLTNRELMEIFGTDICRTIFNLCWVEPLFRQITEQGYPFVVVSDCRNEDEIDYARQVGAKVVRLTRNPHGGTHKIEKALDDYSNFDLVIDNKNMTKEQQGVELINWLLSIGWL